MRRVKYIVAIFAFVFASIFLFGCATPLTSKGAKVRLTFQAENVKSCKYLGHVTSSSSSWEGFENSFERATNELKNKAAEMGANVLLIPTLYNRRGEARIIGDVGDAYYCQNH